MFPDRQLDVDRNWYVQEFGQLMAYTICYELEYYNVFGELPPDATVIERVEWVNDSALIIHRDPDEVKH